jgi:hypothetical protein
MENALMRDQIDFETYEKLVPQISTVCPEVLGIKDVIDLVPGIALAPQGTEVILRNLNSGDVLKGYDSKACRRKQSRWCLVSDVHRRCRPTAG